MFLDIRDFTLLSNQLPSEILVDLLNEIFQIVHECITQAGGIIDKFIGDGVLIHWGAVPGSELSAEKAIDSVKMILQQIDALNGKLARRGMRPIALGVGLHRGLATVGNIGAQERMEFTIIGSEVNFASRLEGLNKIFESNLVVSESLLSAIVGDSGWTIHENVQIRGVPDKVRVASWKYNGVDLDQSTSEVA